MARGTEPPSKEPLIEIPRNASHLKTYLPLGSREGLYDIQVTCVRGEPLFSGAGEAKFNQGLTVLRVDLGTSLPKPGNYLLQLRRPTAEWVSFPLQIR